MLPDIDTTPGRKRSTAGGMATGAKGGAAGFKRDQVVDRTENRGRENPSSANAGFGAGIMNQSGIN